MDDWDTVTKIGSKTRGGGAARETVVRGKSALNAASRSGAIIGTEKKFATGNTATKSGVDGQRAAMLDRADDIVKVPKPPAALGKAIQERRLAMEPTLKQVDLGKKVNKTGNQIAEYESGKVAPDQATLNAMEKVLGIKLTGPNIGQPRFPPKKDAAKKK